MKILQLLLIASVSLVSFIACKKNSSRPADKNGLPKATQNGAQILGFLLNGEPWVPAGKNSLPNLSASYDALYNNGVMSVNAQRAFSASDFEYFGFGIGRDLNLAIPVTYTLTHTSSFNIDYHSLPKAIGLFSSDDTTYCLGSLTLTKFDKVSGIVSGTFNATLASPHTDTVQITEGRFDVKL